MKARTIAFKGMLIKFGMSLERFRVEYVSAAEGIHYAEVIKSCIPNNRLNVSCACPKFLIIAPLSAPLFEKDTS
jgi:hypothetical protein